LGETLGTRLGSVASRLIVTLSESVPPALVASQVSVVPTVDAIFKPPGLIRFYAAADILDSGQSPRTEIGLPYTLEKRINNSVESLMLPVSTIGGYYA
jgi:hypothetical protein